MTLRRPWTLLLASLTAAMPAPALTQAPPSPPTPWRVEDFSTYTSDENYRANPHGWQIPVPRWFNQGKLHLDPTVTYEGHQTLRYDWSTPPTPTAWCMKDITRGAGYKAPDVPEMWIEIAHKFAPTFDTNKRGMGGACGVAEYKFLLFWLKTSQGGHRFDVTSGMNGNQWWSAHPGGPNQTAYGTNCSGVGFKCRLGYGDGQERFRPLVPKTPLYDGQWHVYRVHIKLPTVKGDATGVFEFWLDGVLLKQVTGQTFISSKGVWSNRLDFIALGANSNSGTSQATSNWWGHLKIWTSKPSWAE